MDNINDTSSVASQVARQVADDIRQDLLAQHDLDVLVGYLLDDDVSKEERVHLLENIGIKDGTAFAKDVPHDLLTNDELCTADFMAEYFKCRSLGLSQADSASLCGVSPSRMQRMLRGEGLSETKYRALLLSERQARPYFKRKHLDILDRAASQDWKASKALLELVEPSEFAPQKSGDININNTAVNKTNILEERLSNMSDAQLAKLAEIGDDDAAVD